ncbi:uncharacterized protein K452DRAFT_303084 [Aplosporella prunicola CBS 121167]|uniref:Uncharacterized protein n=1 Tax=Aplosporella prunicola CBS 121167 TaxID=1176127 RepID=A0A6A6AWS9_9PEZI|nr:uncharacterized protein K452DRAFT_303084 [Aplosporella prunicola CBS 121167]KAF2136066.1 hypothetical protein K452DRAFT_303084 [Aplosporella prunicola CBS 121167]
MSCLLQWNLSAAPNTPPASELLFHMPTPTSNLDSINDFMNPFTPSWLPADDFLGSQAAPDVDFDSLSTCLSRQEGSAPCLAQQQPNESQTHAQWLSKVTEVNVKLYGHARHVSWIAESPHIRDRWMSRTNGVFEETFSLSLQLLSILTESESERNSRDFDSGSSLIILSCYIRTLEIYADLFNAVREAISKEDVEGLQLPELATGTVSIGSFPALQLVLIVEIGKKILQRMKACVWRIEHAGVSDVRSREDRVCSTMDGLRLALEPVSSRERQDSFRL